MKWAAASDAQLKLDISHSRHFLDKASSYYVSGLVIFMKNTDVVFRTKLTGSNGHAILHCLPNKLACIEVRGTSRSPVYIEYVIFDGMSFNSTFVRVRAETGVNTLAPVLFRN